MANTAQAKKRARQAEKHRERNVARRTKVRGVIKNVVTLLNEGNAQSARTAYTAALPIIDQMARAGLIHKNKAARHKSRLNTRLRALQA